MNNNEIKDKTIQLYEILNSTTDLEEKNKTKNEILKLNYKIVYKVVNKFNLNNTFPLDYNDLVQTAIFSLYNSLDKYIVGKSSFGTFAQKVIYNGIAMEIKRTKCSLEYKKMQAVKNLSKKGIDFPTTEQLCEEMKIPVYLLKTLERPIPIDGVVSFGSNRDENKAMLIDSIVDESINIEERAINDEQSYILKNFINKLSSNESKFVYLYFYDNLSSYEIAKKCNCTRSYVSKTLQNALKKLSDNKKLIKLLQGEAYYPSSFQKD